MHVPQSDVDMAMSVRLAWWVGEIMSMLMVLIMDVAMTVLHRLVCMFVRMTFREMQPDAYRHQQAGAHQLDRQGFAQQRNGCRRTEERSGGEVGSRPRRSQVAESDHEERKADAITKKADPSGQGDDPERRQLRSTCKCYEEIDRTGNNALQHGDLHGVGEGYLAREVVVDPPREAGASDSEWPERAGEVCPVPPNEHDGARRDKRHAQRYSTIEVFSKEEPRDQGGRRAFQRQQERCRGGLCPGNADHQEHRAHNAARSNRANEPWQLGARNVRIGASPANGPSNPIES